jgi:putative hydrolase of the HAD superfamily
MIQCIIFDLSEVLIAGLVGVEAQLTQLISVPEGDILPGFGGEVFEIFLKGGITENQYFESIISREGWEIEPPRLKAVIRSNFHKRVDGSLEIAQALFSRFEVALHSDHAAEWIAYIKSIHPWIGMFKHTFFSYELKELKRAPKAFEKVLDSLALPPQHCLLVDDNPVNVEVARSVGMRGIHFQNARQLARELRDREIL